ncbi:MAG TPA: polysaccharide biosynthesis/export family protein [Gemmatimonadales bacterium]|nr:polysaccharide biosynthesis/export family protein [Gemmatimonadales bacterium]
MSRHGNSSTFHAAFTAHYNGGVVSWFRNRTLAIALAVSSGSPLGLMGQVPDDPAARSTREQIAATIAEAEKIVNSPGYSGRIKQAKRQEIALLRSRLTDGDLQAGDQIVLSVQGEKDLSATFTVSASRFITLPGIADVSLRGVLRSELQDHLTAELRKYLKDPMVHVQTTVRVSVLGSVGRPGFYQVPSETTIGDAIMLAGGPGSSVDPSKSRVERGGMEILSREAFAQSLLTGRTLDQMSLQAGDEILVGGGRTAGTPGRGGWASVGLPILSGIASLGWIMVQIF